MNTASVSPKGLLDPQVNQTTRCADAGRHDPNSSTFSSDGHYLLNRHSVTGQVQIIGKLASDATAKGAADKLNAYPQLVTTLKTIAEQCGDFATKQPALDYATIATIARHAIANLS